MQVNQPNSSWNMDLMDIGAGSHLAHNQGKIIVPNSFPVRGNILVGNGK